ncbi:MAG: hypothetical protein GKC53_05480 [Neisseriaceae bacterium]|nr:MAG: hypothetical protein GKC53_05480 [Neisseriaceae bacterium]
MRFKFIYLLMTSIILVSCSSISPPKARSVSGKSTLATKEVGNYQNNQVQKLPVKSFNKTFKFFVPYVKEDQAIEYWFYAQHADKITITGYLNEVTEMYQYLLSIGVDCKKLCSVNYQDQPLEITFEKYDKKEEDTVEIDL